MSTENVPETKHHPQPEPRKRGDGNIFPRKGIWWIRYSFRGKPKRESSHSTNPEDAWKLLKRRMKEVWADRQGLQTFIPKADKVLVSELLDALVKDYELNKGQVSSQTKSHLKPIRETFGDMRAVAVTTKHVDKYIKHRLEEDQSAPATINKEIGLLSRAFKLGRQRDEIIAAPYIRRLPENNVRQGFFEHAEFEAVVGALPEDLQDFVRFAYLCAWRKGQVASLTWADWDSAAGLIIARRENVKNRRPHKLVLEGELAAIIERRWLAKSAVSEYIFHRNGRPIRDLRKAWAAACEVAGVPGRLFHDLRRSAVRNMVRAGVREGDAMATSGHRTRAIFDRYNITSDDDLREASRRTQEYLKGQPAVSNVAAFGKAASK